LSEHAREILTEAGLDESAIEKLFVAGVVVGPLAALHPPATV
jgi:hypothetical protein